MSDSRSPSLATRIIFYVASSVLATAGLQPAFAKSASPVQTLSQTLRKQATESKVKPLAVADFVTTGGAASPEGLYFADLIYLYEAEPPKKFTLVQRDAVSHFLGVREIAPASLNRVDVLKQVGESLGADVILTGTVDAGEQSLAIHATLKRVADGSVIGEASVAIPQDAFYRTLRSYPEPPKLSSITSVDEKGVHAPVPRLAGTTVSRPSSRQELNVREDPYGLISDDDIGRRPIGSATGGQRRSTRIC